MIKPELKPKIIELVNKFQLDLDKLLEEKLDILVFVYDTDESYISNTGSRILALKRIFASNLNLIVNDLKKVGL